VITLAAQPPEEGAFEQLGVKVAGGVEHVSSLRIRAPGIFPAAVERLFAG
jgi:hypothetical protein